MLRGLVAKMDYEKANRVKRRSRMGDHKPPPGVQSWSKVRPMYHARCKQCGGTILAGYPAWYRRIDGKHAYKCIGHSPT